MEVEFALPRELSLEQQEAVVKEFIQVNIPKQPHTWAIHEGKGTNPHCHLVFNERTLDGVKRNRETFFKRANNKHPEKGGAAKKRYLKSTDFLMSIRKSWETHANEALKSANKKVEVDCRTLNAQGIDRAPQIHLGPARVGRIARELRERKEQYNDAINQEWSDQDLQRIAREIAESEARGRKNRLAIARAVEFFNAEDGERVRISAENVKGVRELHESSAGALVLAQGRGRRVQFDRKIELANGVNRKSDELNREEIQRDRERGRGLRQRQSHGSLKDLSLLLEYACIGLKYSIEQLGDKIERCRERIENKYLRKIKSFSSIRLTPRQDRSNDPNKGVRF